MTTITLTDGCLGNEKLSVRCDLSQASSPVEVDYHTGNGWEPTQYQCADARHQASRLDAIARALAGAACEADAADCDATATDGDA
jgi:hypothetical protein